MSLELYVEVRAHWWSVQAAVRGYLAVKVVVESSRIVREPSFSIIFYQYAIHSSFLPVCAD